MANPAIGAQDERLIARLCLLELEGPLLDRTRFAVIFPGDSQAWSAMLPLPEDLVAEGWKARLLLHGDALLGIGEDGRLYATRAAGESLWSTHQRLDASAAYQVPINGVVFVSERLALHPPIAQSLSWRHGVFYGATMSVDTRSQLPASAIDARHDAFGLGSICGSRLAEYVGQWLELGKRLGKQAPPLFRVNLHPTTDDALLNPWPDSADIVRLLLWMRERSFGRGASHLTAIGEIPTPASLQTAGIHLAPEDEAYLSALDEEAWADESFAIEAYLRSLGDHLPVEMENELRALDIRLVSPWLNATDSNNVFAVKGACGRSLIQRRSTNGRLTLHVQQSVAEHGDSPCTRCRRDCLGDLFALAPTAAP